MSRSMNLTILKGAKINSLNLWHFRAHYQVHVFKKSTEKENKDTYKLKQTISSAKQSIGKRHTAQAIFNHNFLFQLLTTTEQSQSASMGWRVKSVPFVLRQICICGVWCGWCWWVPPGIHVLYKPINTETQLLSFDSSFLKKTAKRLISTPPNSMVFEWF